MNARQARIHALGGLTAVCSLGAGGMGEAFPQYRDDLAEWTEQEELALCRAFKKLHGELADRLARLEQRQSRSTK